MAVEGGLERHRTLQTENAGKMRFGAYELVRELAPSPGTTLTAERWLALHERDNSSHVVYRFPVRHDKPGQRRFFEAVEPVALLKDSHLLEIEQYSICSTGRGMIVTPFTGNQDGLTTLGTLVEMKGGRMSPHETDRAINHLLEGLAVAHSTTGVGACHGPLMLDEVLVDRHGRLVIELYGLASRLKGVQFSAADGVRDEIRSVAGIAYRLLTGLLAEEPRIEADRLVKGLSPLWTRWLARGLDLVDGFATVADAIEALPSNARDTVDELSRGAVRKVLSKFRWPSRSR